jgi:hypothetical protein
VAMTGTAGMPLTHWAFPYWAECHEMFASGAPGLVTKATNVKFSFVHSRGYHNSNSHSLNKLNPCPRKI